MCVCGLASSGMPCDLKHLLFEGQQHTRDIRDGLCAHADRPGFVDPDGLVPTLALDEQNILSGVLAELGVARVVPLAAVDKVEPEQKEVGTEEQGD